MSCATLKVTRVLATLKLQGVFDYYTELRGWQVLKDVRFLCFIYH